MIVVGHPFGNGTSGMIDAEELAFIEQLVAHAAVETFDVAILRRPSLCDVVPLDLVILRPCKNGIRGEFGPFVGDDHAGLASPLDQHRQLSGDTATEIDVSGTAARHSRVTSSTTLSTRKRLPHANWS